MSFMVSSIMSLKNVIIGDLLYHNTYVWLALSFALILSTLPMFIFIYIMISNGMYDSMIDFIFNRPNKKDQQEGDAIFTIDSDTDSVHDIETWTVDGRF